MPSAPDIRCSAYFQRSFMALLRRRLARPSDDHHDARYQEEEQRAPKADTGNPYQVFVGEREPVEQHQETCQYRQPSQRTVHCSRHGNQHSGQQDGQAHNVDENLEGELPE